MRDNASKYVDAQHSQRNNEHVEETIVPFAHTVPHPGAMMIKTFWNICWNQKSLDNKTGNLPTQLSHKLQCDARGGRNILHVKQYFNLID